MYKRKRSIKGGKRKRFKRSYKSSAFGYGPVGGVRPGRRGTSQTIARSPSTGPDRIFIKATKCFVGTIQTATAGGFTTATLKLNSANDPLGSLGSGPPVGISPLLGTTGSMYQAYIVHAFKVSVTFNQQSAGNGLMVALRFRVGAAASASSMTTNCAFPHTVSRLAPGYGSSNPVTMAMYATTGSIYGQSPQTVAIADSFSALYNADPTSAVIGDLSLVDVNATTQHTGGFVIRITQWIELYGRTTNA